MKTLRRMLVGAAALLAAITQTQAIEDLKIVVNQQTNVVLSWPSVSGETFIIEYRETLSPATP